MRKWSAEEDERLLENKTSPEDLQSRIKEVLSPLDGQPARTPAAVLSRLWTLKVSDSSDSFEKELMRRKNKTPPLPLNREKWLTASEVKTEFGYSDKTLYGWRTRRKDIGFRKVDGVYYFRLDDVKKHRKSSPPNRASEMKINTKTKRQPHKLEQLELTAPEERNGHAQPERNGHAQPAPFDNLRLVFSLTKSGFDYEHIKKVLKALES